MQNVSSNKGPQSLGYENERSVVEKTRFARTELGVSGVMVFGLHMDDSAGSCGRGRYPLINAIRGALASKRHQHSSSTNARRRTDKGLKLDE